IRGCSAEEAMRILEGYAGAGMTTKEFYRLMQEWIGNRTLVDKTPSYPLDMAVLKRSESDFQDAMHIHLVRHPAGMIRSFKEARLDQVSTTIPHFFSGEAYAEIVWDVSQMNIAEFLKSVPEARQYQVRFEDLVREPGPTVEGICRFLGID